MQELSPNEFQEMLDENGEISAAYLSKEDKEKISLVRMIHHARGNARIKCNLCNGTGFSNNGRGPFECPRCQGNRFV